MAGSEFSEEISETEDPERRQIKKILSWVRKWWRQK
jgi:hypothetical protein